MFDQIAEERPATQNLNRRVFLSLTVAAIGGASALLWRRERFTEAEQVPSGPPKIVRIVEFSDAGDRKGMVEVPKIVKPDSEWQKQLTPAAFDITRNGDTEIAFTGSYWNSHGVGIYRCICCDSALFDSRTKFDSGTGWPSFWEPIAKENIAEQPDSSWGMQRIAVSCARCDAHLGHVFDDGPEPTGLRYCINSVALRFAKA